MASNTISSIREEEHEWQSQQLTALIVSPNSPRDESGTVKLSHVKATKVSKICDDIEFLISNSESSLSQVYYH